MRLNDELNKKTMPNSPNGVDGKCGKYQLCRE